MNPPTRFPSSNLSTVMKNTPTGPSNTGESAVSSRFSDGKIISVLLVCLLALVGTVQNADALSYIEGPLTFTYNQTHAYAVVSKCDSTATGSLVIPSEIQPPGFPNLIVNTIKTDAFRGCSSLTSIAIPSGVLYIQDYAFLGCSSLTSIALPSGAVFIGDAVFWGCSSLTSIILPTVVTSIPASTFYDCRSLTSIVIPTGVTSIGTHAFYNCSSLTSIVIPTGVTSIKDRVFYGCNSLTSIDIPSGVTSIGESAFYDCRSLTNLAIPSGVTSIGQGAFDRCLSLTSINIPSGVTSIGSNTFRACVSLTSIGIPSGVTSIGEGAFDACGSLASISIPSGIISIGDAAFRSCRSLTSISIPSGITSIGASTFARCESLTSIAIPSGVTSIGDAAFYWCSSLTSITIPSGVTSIGHIAFLRCSSLAKLDLPADLISIGERAFSRCGLTSIAIPSGVTSIDKSTFDYCESLTDVALSNSVTDIGDYAFRGCGSLPEITIPAGVTSIGRYAFEACIQLDEITIPASVSSIGDGAFKDCISLKRCLFFSNAPATFGNLVFDLSSDFTINYFSSSTGFTTPYWQGYPCSPLSPDSISLGTVNRIKGDVEATRNGKTRRLKLDDELYENDVITTKSQSFVRILLTDESNINIGPRSSITLKFKPIDPYVKATLHRGFIRVNKAPNGRRLIVKTKTAAIGVRNTTLTVEVSEESGMLTTTGEVLVGVVDYENLVTGEVLELRTGESASSQAAPETHTLTLNNASTALGSLWLNGTEITSFPHVVTFAQGTELNLQAVPNAAGVFSTWTGGIVSTNPNYHYFLDEDVTVLGNFLPLTDFATEHPGLDRDGDANGNGLSNFLDFGGGQDPEAHSPLPLVELSENVLTLHQRINGLDARPAAFYSDNLSDWFPLEEGVHYNYSNETATGASRKVEIYLKADQPATRFFRQAFGP